MQFDTEPVSLGDISPFPFLTGPIWSWCRCCEQTALLACHAAKRMAQFALLDRPAMRSIAPLSRFLTKADRLARDTTGRMRAGALPHCSVIVVRSFSPPVPVLPCGSARRCDQHGTCPRNHTVANAQPVNGHDKQQRPCGIQGFPWTPVFTT